MQRAFRTLHATEEELKTNEYINGDRTSAEWSQGEVKRFFSTQDYSRKLKIAK